MMVLIIIWGVFLIEGREFVVLWAGKDNINAYNCLAELREKLLKIKQTELQISPSNGEFYYLSNEQEIGWKKHWQEKYKK